MNRKNLLIPFILVACGTYAQSDSLNFDPRGRMTGKDVFVFEFKNDGLLDLPSGIKSRGYSPGVNVYIYSDFSLDYKNDEFSIGLGYGLSSDNYHTNAIPITVEDDGKDLGLFVPLPDSIDYQKNKLSLTYLEVLFEFRFVEKSRKFRFHAGAKGGYLISSHTKFKTEDEKTKQYGIDSVNKWRYGLQGRVGFGRIAVSGFYSLTDLFAEAKSDTAVPWYLGIAIIPF